MASRSVTTPARWACNGLMPIRWGDNPQDQSKGRLHGVSARLYPGDQVGLMRVPEHPTYTSVFSPALGQVSVSGMV